LYVKVKFVKIQGMTNRRKLWTILYWLWSAKVWVSNGICNPSSPYPDRWGLDLNFLIFNLKLTRKSSTWQVMLQSRKSRELTVNFSSCGSYDLIWCNALHLTSSSRFCYNLVVNKNYKIYIIFLFKWNLRWCMAVVNSCFDMFG
jgi:hypothetical protein